MHPSPGFELISTCPESAHVPPDRYLQRVRETASWCEEAGHSALMVHSDHRLLDAWVVAQVILASTEALRPVVSVQPLYMHPYAVAKKVASLARLFGRGPDLNLVAGGFRSDLLALDDSTRHDDRYRRLREYGALIKLLLASDEPVEFDGDFYRVHKPRALAALPPELQPSLFVAGTSEAGRNTASALGARSVGQLGIDGHAVDCVRLGILARQDEHTAWDTARERFPGGRGSALQQRLEVSLGDSRWQQQLDDMSQDEVGDPLWMQPYRVRRAPCAYLVGDYRTVARRLVDLLDAGTRSFVLDSPASAEELSHVSCAFDRAWSRFTTPLALSH